MQLNPETDLELICHLKAPPAKIWRCWAEAHLLEQWFAPKPVVTRDVRIELWPGGSFITTMDIPEEGTMTGHGCILAVEPERQLIWTDLLAKDYRPNQGAFGFTAHILLEPEGSGTLYRAMALHATPEGRLAHEEMGFHQGWGIAAAQLDALALGLS